MPRSKGIRELIRKLEDQAGWKVEYRKGGHYRVTGPNGVLIFLAATPSDYRTVLNARASLRRLGAAV